MTRSYPFLALLAWSTTLAAVGDDGPKLRSRGAAVDEADAATRAAFAAAYPGVLPESRPRRAMPGADAPAFDWTEWIKPDRVRNQKGSTASWAFAATSAFEWSWAIRNGLHRTPELAVQPVLDRVGEEGSGSAARAFDDLLRNGTCTAKEYVHQGRPGKLRAGVPMIYRAISWGTVAPEGQEPSTAEIKRAVVDHGPVVSGVYLTRAFQAYRSGVFSERAAPPAGAPPGGHSVVIVGWDDRRGRDGCWKVENSWGIGWGERGYIWIEYGSNTIGRSAWWVRAQATQYDLPDGIEKLVDPPVAPFPKWPDARPVKLPAGRR